MAGSLPDIDNLLALSARKVKQVSLHFRRYLEQRIDWNDRLIMITGARGSGKTTMLLQYMREHFGSSDKALYVSLDNIWFQGNRVIELADTFAKLGGTHLFLDEVHKYPGWSREIKNIYDDYPELKVVVTGSSVLELNSGEADLSRRMIRYQLAGLSFREFLELEHGLSFEPVSLNALLKNHVRLAEDVVREIRPLAPFRHYLTYGYYPYFRENRNNYPQRLAQTINLILETDIPLVHQMEYTSVNKLKKLLYIISQSAPFKPNITEITKEIGGNRASTIKLLDILEDAQLILLLRTEKKGLSYLRKPDKIYLNHPNLMYALTGASMNEGNLRETFFFNQLQMAHEVRSHEKTDFLVDDAWAFEVGGRSKSSGQLAGLKNGFIAAEGSEVGLRNKIPLWLFGMLY